MGLRTKEVAVVFERLRSCPDFGRTKSDREESQKSKIMVT